MMWVMVMAMFLVLTSCATDAYDGWDVATATFYSDMSAGETMEGACGYGNLFDEGYGLEMTALSTALFNSGLTCGACYQIVCHNESQWCIQRAGAIHVTATNLCPPNYTKTHDIWCNPPHKHFDLSQPIFRKIAKYEAIPVYYRRVTCARVGGIEFEIKGNPSGIVVLVYNVAGAGDISSVQIKGQNWQVSSDLLEQSLSFQVTTSDGKIVRSDNGAPPNWRFGNTYEGNQF